MIKIQASQKDSFRLKFTCKQFKSLLVKCSMTDKRSEWWQNWLTKMNNLSGSNSESQQKLDFEMIPWMLSQNTDIYQRNYPHFLKIDA